MARVTSWALMGAFALYHTPPASTSSASTTTVTTTTTTTTTTIFNVSDGDHHRGVHPALTNTRADCPATMPTQAVTIVISCSGALLNGMALSVVSRNRELAALFRAVLSSLTVAGLGLGLTSTLLASGALLQMSLTNTDDQQQQQQQQKQDPLDLSALSAVCNVMNGVYHGLLVGGASTILALSLDRVMAVFTPVRYRALGLSGRKMSTIIFPAWLLALVSVSALPLTWSFHDDRDHVARVGLSAMSCWPLVAAHSEFLTYQAIILLTSSIGVTTALLATIHKLTRRAILVVPIFGPRTADTTARERRQARRTVGYAAVQVLLFCCLYLPFAAYLLALAAAVDDRLSEACSIRFLCLSLLPALNSILNPLLTLWQLRGHCHPLLRKCLGIIGRGGGGGQSSAGVGSDTGAATSTGHSGLAGPTGLNNPSHSPGLNVHAISHTHSLFVTTTEVTSVPAKGEATGKGEGKKAKAEAGPSDGGGRQGTKHGHRRRKRSPPQPRKDSKGNDWQPPRDNYCMDDCRADPSLLTDMPQAVDDNDCNGDDKTDENDDCLV